MSDTPRPDTLPLSLERRIEEVCVRFEDAWRAGRPPALEPFLGEVPPEGQSALLRELLKLDLHYRRQQGDQPTADEYRPRFPGDGGLIEQVFTEAVSGPDPAGAPPAVAPGRLLSERYEILGEVGRGGMGVVFRAADRTLRREVALKLLRADRAHAEARERFLREAQALAALDDEHVVPIYEAGEADGHPFFIMPLLRGETLAARLERGGALPAADVARLGEQVARGLAAAHARGLIHRDVKPSNIWLTRPDGEGGGTPGHWGQALLMDFGLTRFGAPADAATRPDTLTQPGALLGTVRYMAPEQIDDPARADARSDLFGLGCVLYEAATGRRAFDGATTMRVLRQIATQAPPPPAAVNPAVPAALSDLVVQLLAVDPAARPASAAAVADRLRDSLAAPPAPAAPPRRRRVALAAALLAVPLVGAGLGYVRFGRPPHPAESSPVSAVERPPAPAAPARANIDREVAQWALAQGADEIVVATPATDWLLLRPGDPLPEGPFELRRLDLRRIRGLGNDDLARLRPLASLNALDVSSPLVTDDGLEHLTQPYLMHLRLRGLPRITDRAARRLGQMTQLKELFIGETSFTDAGLADLKDLIGLMELDLRGLSGVTDDGLRHLRHFPALRLLYLQRTKVTDAGLKHLKPLTHLEVLYLDDLSGITDEGLRHLGHLGALQELNLAYTRVTVGGAQAFRQAHPGCKVIH